MLYLESLSLKSVSRNSLCSLCNTINAGDTLMSSQLPKCNNTNTRCLTLVSIMKLTISWSACLTMLATLASSSAFTCLKEKKKTILHFWCPVQTFFTELACTKYKTSTILSVVMNKVMTCDFWSGSLHKWKLFVKILRKMVKWFYWYSSSLVRRSSVDIVDGPQADFTRGLRSAAMGLSALLLEDGRFTV